MVDLRGAFETALEQGPEALFAFGMECRERDLDINRLKRLPTIFVRIISRARRDMAIAGIVERPGRGLAHPLSAEEILGRHLLEMLL